MAVKVAINGFGRIGRLVLRAMVESGRTDVECVAINDLADVATSAHLFRYDSVHGRFPGEVEVNGNQITIKYNGRTWGPITVSAERDPTKVPYQGVDVAMECTGIFASKEKASALLQAGAKKVLISAPGDNVDATIVYGVNHGTMTKDMTVISNASCTTNCLTPVAKVLHDTWGIERGYMLTIHAYTSDQMLQDGLHKDLHRARAANLSMIPTSTGAARAVGLVMPDLKGKLDGSSMRVPTPNVSVVDLTVARRGAEEDPHQGRDQRRHEGRQRVWPAEGHPGLQHRPAGQQRLQPRGLQLRVRRHADRGGRWRPGARAHLVRQRVGLLEPHVRYGGPVRLALKQASLLFLKKKKQKDFIRLRPFLPGECRANG